MNVRRILLILLPMKVLLGVILSSRSPQRRPAMALYFTRAAQTNGATEVRVRFENHPGNIAVRSAALLAPNGRDWEPVSETKGPLRILNDWAVTVTPTNAPRRFVAEIQEPATGATGIKELFIEILHTIRLGGDVSVHTGRKTFVTNDVPFVSDPPTTP
jgi:hypothetical protein